jgi:ATP-dependent DNA helicase HFM1/MER3|tara:strand:- start:50 stop:421 length:372 start_codon:yes stop_codon:yes gene_type:complete
LNETKPKPSQTPSQLMAHLTTLPVSTVISEPDIAALFSFPSFNGMQCQLLQHVLLKSSSILLSSPTGSGKTVIFELALVQMIRNMKQNGSFVPGARKAVYIAPMRSLVAERKTDWERRFRQLG